MMEIWRDVFHQKGKIYQQDRCIFMVNSRETEAS